MKNRLVNLSKVIIVSFLIFIPSIFGCQSGNHKDHRLILDPPLNKEFHYSIIRILSRTIDDNTRADSLKFDFNIEQTGEFDTLNILKITFNNFSWKKPPVNMRLVDRGYTPSPKLLDSMSRGILRINNALDSVGFFMRGIAIEVTMNEAGHVLDVTGIDGLLEKLAQSTRISKGSLRRSLSDQISVDALKDLLNTIFSIVPGASVHEADKWYPAFVLTTKAPVKVSSIMELDRIVGDTAFVTIQSLLSGQQSEGGTVYMKGEQKGIATISNSTGMPYRYETTTELLNINSQRNYPGTEYLLLERK